MSRAADIEEIAARWVARMDEPSWSTADQTALDAWLDESMEHRVAYLRLQSVWRRADRLAALGPTAARSRFALPLSRAAAVAAAVVLGAGAVALFPQLGGKSYRTEVGEHATVPLPDGSKVELNTDTKVRADLDEEHREVWLDRGEAYFDVAHDPSRPFVVHAGKQKVTVLGTHFSVRRQRDGVEVAVVDGKVRVEPARAAKAKPALVTRGDMVVAKGPSILVAARSVEKVENELSWREGMLVFDRSTLADAVNEFNRYNRKKLVIDDEAVAALRIGGSFEAVNVDAFARLLQEAFGLSVEDDGDEIRISS